MAELVIALAPLLVLAGIALLATFVPLTWLGSFALSLILIGFVFGVPAGLYYHLLLWRELTREGPAPKGWYWRPQHYHHGLGEQSSARMRRWFLLGAAGFALIVFGFLLAVLTVLLWFRQGH